MRSKHGRDLLFSSPELMWEAACEYFAHEDSRTDLQSEEVGWYQGTSQVHIKTHKIPYTWQGLCLYFGCALSYFKNKRLEIKKRIAEETADETDEYFLAVIDLIGQTIFKQQYDAGQAGIFKEGLTSKYLKMQSDNTATTDSNDPEHPNNAIKEYKVTLKLD